MCSFMYIKEQSLYLECLKKQARATLIHIMYCMPIISFHVYITEEPKLIVCTCTCNSNFPRHFLTEHLQVINIP